jgi:hypothetical protein
MILEIDRNTEHQTLKQAESQSMLYGFDGDWALGSKFINN